MSEGLGFGRKALIEKIVKANWKINHPERKKFTYTELLFVIQEMLDEEGKHYYHKKSAMRGHHIFREFMKLLMYRNLANYDSMVLLTGDKGSGKSSCAIMMAREWLNMQGRQFDPKRHIAYNNADIMNKIDQLDKFEVIVCISGDTYVTVKIDNNIQTLKIKDLKNKKDFEIQSYSLNVDRSIFSKAEKCIETHKSSEVYEIELENGLKIKATEDHQFLTEGGYKKLKELTENDFIVLGGDESKKQKKNNYYNKNRDNIIEKNKEYNRKHRNQKIKYLREYRVKNKDKLKIKRDGKIIKNPEKYKEIAKRTRTKHKKKRNKESREYYQKNKEKIRKQNKEWIKNNYQRYRKYLNDRHKQLMESDPEYKIKRNLRRRIGIALKEQGTTKHKSLNKYIGCTVEELKKHLESKFVDGMSWDNYGDWHVDHIKPCISFNLTKEEEQKKCFNYINLQPLWAKDNLSKGGSV